MSKFFYTELKPLLDYSQMVEADNYIDLPDDWVCILTDVRNSTRAIEDGRYKEVNIIGVSTIVAVQNALGATQFPFVFGGDGATLAVPVSELERAKASLSHTRQVSQQQFGLILRIAVIPAPEIRRAGGRLMIAKLRISDTQNLALLRGNGWTMAERWMKEREAEFDLPADHPGEGDYTGLECRWNPLPARKDEVMALIIQARVGGDKAASIYRAILKDVLGPELRPLSLNELNLRWPPRYLVQESKVKIRGAVERAIYILSMSAKVLLQVLYLAVRGHKKNIEQPIEYLRELHENTDYLKFDECLRMVIDVNAEQKARLFQLLDAYVQSGELSYGYHCDPCALLTCFIQGPHKHIHFVDAANGGYAMAAKQLKAARSTKQ
jgi:hypothetical protein